MTKEKFTYQDWLAGKLDNIESGEYNIPKNWPIAKGQEPIMLNKSGFLEKEELEKINNYRKNIFDKLVTIDATSAFNHIRDQINLLPEHKRSNEFEAELEEVNKKLNSYSRSEIRKAKSGSKVMLGFNYSFCETGKARIKKFEKSDKNKYKGWMKPTYHNSEGSTRFNANFMVHTLLKRRDLISDNLLEMNVSVQDMTEEQIIEKVKMLVDDCRSKDEYCWEGQLDIRKVDERIMKYFNRKERWVRDKRSKAGLTDQNYNRKK